MKKKTKRTKKTSPKTTKRRSKASKTSKKKRGRPDASDTENANEPAWGPKIVLGTVLGVDVYVQQPLNKAALDRVTTLSGVALTLYERIDKLEKQVQDMSRDLDLHRRLSRIEEQLRDD